jgi:biotin carboxylase
LSTHHEKRLLLFAATTGYQIRVFADAARRMGVTLTLATDRCHVMDDPWGDQAVAVKFDRIHESVDSLRDMRFDGVAAVGDAPAVLAAATAEALGLPFHPLAAALACNDKYVAREAYRKAGLRVPAFFRVAGWEGPDAAVRRAPFPCVLKPVGLSASRGVIRANNEAEFRAAFARIRAMVPAESYLQVESYIPGREFALEGVVTGGELQTLAIFDKPDPLEGPFFEETIYVTPSREAGCVQQSLIDTTAAAVRALDLRHGPVHAELRHNSEGSWMLEAAARPIGGLCAKALRFDDGMPLEELLLRQALGQDVSRLRREDAASGVMMIPIPRNGIYRGVSGVDGALAVDGVENVEITAQEGQRLIPLPEGASYLGFIFARSATSGQVEAALRQAHGELRFELLTALDTIR